MKSWATLLQQETQKQVREPEGKGWQTFDEIHESLGARRRQDSPRDKTISARW
jgi:hypothetical protein